jgi:transposase
LPSEQRVAQLRVPAQPPAQSLRLREITRRQEHLIAGLNHTLHGKRSEKLSEDERQLAFEDLSIALAEVEAEKETRAAKADNGAGKPAPKRTTDNLPATLPRLEEGIEPDSLICPCRCGVMRKIGEDRSERLDVVPWGGIGRAIALRPAQVGAQVIATDNTPAAHDETLDALGTSAFPSRAICASVSQKRLLIRKAF